MLRASAIPFTLLLLLLAGLLASVWQGSRPSASESDDELRIVVAGSLRSLDPQRLRELPSLENRLIDALWQPLLRLDAAGLTAAPGVATRWELADDGRTLRLELDPAARWSNGDAVTAEDFVRSLAHWRRVDRSHPFSALLGGATDPAVLRAAVRAVDRHTVLFTAASPRPDLAARLATARWCPTHVSAVAVHDGMGLPRDAFVTNGPYFYAGSRRGEVALERNQYFPASAGMPERVRALTTHTSALYGTLIQAGRAHLADHLGLARDALDLRGIDVVAEEEPTASISLLQFNASRAPLNDPRVRRALMLALDRAELAAGFAGTGALPAYSFTPPGRSEPQPVRTVVEDVAEARRLLAEAGFPDGARFPVLRFPVVVGEGLVNPLAFLCAEQWRARLGVQVYVVPVVREELLTRAGADEFDLMHLRWSAQAFDVSLLPSQLREQLPAPFRVWSSPEVYAAIARADALTGDARRAALLAAERAFVDEVPATPTVTYRRTTLRHRRLEGWTADVFGLHSLRQLTLAPVPGGQR